MAFPKLEPAMTIRVTIDASLAIGSASRASPLVAVPMVSGTLITEPSFSGPKLDAELHGTGWDYIRQDPDGAHLRLDVRSQAKNKPDGALFALYYTGTITATPEINAVFAGHESAKTTDYGNVFTFVRFETGAQSLKELENIEFVGSGHFVLEGGKTTVEYKVSRVVQG